MAGCVITSYSIHYTKLYDASITRQYGGTGLGLTICSRLAAKMGGEITLVSQPGQGSDFTFTWVPEKIQRSQPAVADSEKVLIDYGNGGEPDFATLVVEDNVVNSKVIELSLKKNGISISKASNGVEALERLKQRHFDLIFMDIQMPEMDGLKCTETIRKEFQKDRVITSYSIHYTKLYDGLLPSLTRSLRCTMK